MRLRSLLAGMLLVCCSAAAHSQAVLQSGGAIGGRMAMYVPSGSNISGAPGYIKDSGPSGNYILGQGINEYLQVNRFPGNGPFGAHNCGYDNPDPTQAQYYLCWDAKANGGGLLAYGSLNNAPSLPLTWEINGTAYQFPFALSGIAGPGSTTSNELAVWNNGVGSLLRQHAPAQLSDAQTASITADGAALTQYSQSGTAAQSIYNQAVMSGSGTVFQGYDSSRGVAIAPALSTVNTITGVAGYVLNNTVPVGQRSQTVSLFGVGVCAVNGSNCWGVDTIVSDNPTLVNTGQTSGTGKFLFNEFDLNITSPSTGGTTLQLGGTALPTNTTLAINALAVLKLWGAGGSGTGTALYSNGIVLTNACCATGMNIGASALSGTNKTGMPVVFQYFDGSGALQSDTITAAFNSLTIGGSSAWGITLANGSGNPNGLSLGALSTSGSNIASQFAIWNYFDASGTARNYSIGVNAAQQMVFTGSAGATGIMAFNGQVQTLGSANTNAFNAGPQSASPAANVPSQISLWSYYDSGSALQNYSIGANASQKLVFAGTVGSSSAVFDFEGGLSVKGNLGVNCNGSPTASFASVNGLVTHC